MGQEVAESVQEFASNARPDGVAVLPETRQMKLLPQRAARFAIVGLLICAGVEVRAQTLSTAPTPWGGDSRQALWVNGGADDSGTATVDTPQGNGEACQFCSGSCRQQGCPASCCVYQDPGFYAGAEYLLVRPHFSEAIAFARGSQTLTTYEVEGRELQFDYDNSFRIFAGYRPGDGGGEFRFTYWRFCGDISVEGTAEAGQFLVDPFGNVVGTAVIINPADRRFRTLESILLGGDLIRTKATVETNVYDLDFIKPVLLSSPNWGLNWSAGVRIADIDQYYESVIMLEGGAFSRGDFSADFIGAGPRLGVEARRYLGAEGRLALFVNAHGALLVGEDTVRSSNAPNAFFVARQSESLTRTIPVTETELGVSWQVGDSLSLSAGWLFQAWFDMGTSGGQFGGFFSGADDSNIMSFDGMFLRGEWAF